MIKRILIKFENLQIIIYELFFALYTTFQLRQTHQKNTFPIIMILYFQGNISFFSHSLTAFKLNLRSVKKSLT